MLPGVEHALPVMTTVASRNFVASDSSLGVFTVRLVIGQPYRVAENEWACSIALDGLYEHLWDQHGVDSFQALMQAQNLARTLLGDFVTNGGVLLNAPGGAPIVVDQLFSSGEMT